MIRQKSLPVSLPLSEEDSTILKEMLKYVEDSTDEEIAERETRILDGAETFIDNMAPSSIQVRLVAYTKETSWAGHAHVKSDIIRQIIHRYREEGIEFAFPSTSIYMAK